MFDFYETKKNCFSTYTLDWQCLSAVRCTPKLFKFPTFNYLGNYFFELTSFVERQFSAGINTFSNLEWWQFLALLCNPLLSDNSKNVSGRSDWQILLFTTIHFNTNEKYLPIDMDGWFLIWVELTDMDAVPWILNWLWLARPWLVVVLDKFWSP